MSLKTLSIFNDNFYNKNYRNYKLYKYNSSQATIEFQKYFNNIKEYRKYFFVFHAEIHKKGK